MRGETVGIVALFLKPSYYAKHSSSSTAKKRPVGGIGSKSGSALSHNSRLLSSAMGGGWQTLLALWPSTSGAVTRLPRKHSEAPEKAEGLRAGRAVLLFCRPHSLMASIRTQCCRNRRLLDISDRIMPRTCLLLPTALLFARAGNVPVRYRPSIRLRAPLSQLFLALLVPPLDYPQ